jgi:hypothetical protein
MSANGHFYKPADKSNVSYFNYGRVASPIRIDTQANIYYLRKRLKIVFCKITFFLLELYITIPNQDRNHNPAIFFVIKGV